MEDNDSLVLEFPEIFSIDKATGTMVVNIFNLRKLKNDENKLQIGDLTLHGRTSLNELKVLALDLLKQEEVKNYLESNKTYNKAIGKAMFG